MQPFYWVLGQITQLDAGSDGIPRFVSVKISNNSVLKRPISKVSVVPVDT